MGFRDCVYVCTCERVCVQVCVHVRVCVCLGGGGGRGELSSAISHTTWIAITLTQTIVLRLQPPYLAHAVPLSRLAACVNAAMWLVLCILYLNVHFDFLVSLPREPCIKNTCAFVVF